LAEKSTAGQSLWVLWSTIVFVKLALYFRVVSKYVTYPANSALNITNGVLFVNVMPPIVVLFVNVMPSDRGSVR
jgi:hypothetical protein